MTTQETDLVHRLVQMKTDAELRRGNFHVGRRLVTRQECDTELERRRGLRAYAAKLKAWGVQ